ncbi:MAG: rhomboid family intramembrane serine protease [Ardenticatenaceae bacterium]
MEEPAPMNSASSFEEQKPARVMTDLSLPLHNSWLTRVILVFNVLMFVLLSLFSAVFSTNGLIDAVLNGATIEALIVFGAKFNPFIIEGQYWRLLTPIFLHIGMMHLLFNEYALAIFGREVETLFGTARFAAIYLLTGLFGSLASFAFSPAVSAGASGAIFGIIGAMVAYLYRNRKTLGERGRQHFRSLLTMIALNVFLGITIPGIDNFGHMGGLFSGLILGAILTPTYALQRLQMPPFVEVVEQPPLLPTALVIVLALALIVGGTFLAIG